MRALMVAATTGIGTTIPVLMGLAGPMSHFRCLVPVQVRADKQTYRETYRDTGTGTSTGTAVLAVGPKNKS